MEEKGRIEARRLRPFPSGLHWTRGRPFPLVTGYLWGGWSGARQPIPRSGSTSGAHGDDAERRGVFLSLIVQSGIGHALVMCVDIWEESRSYLQRVKISRSRWWDRTPSVRHLVSSEEIVTNLHSIDQRLLRIGDLFHSRSSEE